MQPGAPRRCGVQTARISTFLPPADEPCRWSTDGHDKIELALGKLGLKVVTERGLVLIGTETLGHVRGIEDLHGPRLPKLHLLGTVARMFVVSAPSSQNLLLLLLFEGR
jgi:hypothetical protein